MKKNEKRKYLLNLQTFAEPKSLIRLEEIRSRKLEIREKLSGTEEIKPDELDKLDEELRNLETEQTQIEKRAAMAAKINDAPVTKSNTDTDQRDITGNETEVEQRENKNKEMEQRGKDLKENRSITVGSSTILLKAHQATDIKDTFNNVSSLVDRVSFMPLEGGESYSQPYIDSWGGEADYTAMNADYHEVDGATFKSAVISKTKITAYHEMPEEIEKLPDAPYAQVTESGIDRALRLKLTRQILIGAGTAGTIVGIFTANATAIDTATDFEVTTIGEDTLDDIVYAYGGIEEVESEHVLILNKKDLRAFDALRDKNGRKLHVVTKNGNTGTIDTVPYIINSVCKAISDTTTSAGDYAMAYGPLENYQLTQFSAKDIQKSTDFKFKSGQICFKGNVFMGGNVIKKNGFLRIKKK